MWALAASGSERLNGKPEMSFARNHLMPREKQHLPGWGSVPIPKPRASVSQRQLSSGCSFAFPSTSPASAHTHTQQTFGSLSQLERKNFSNPQNSVSFFKITKNLQIWSLKPNKNGGENVNNLATKLQSNRIFLPVSEWKKGGVDGSGNLSVASAFTLLGLITNTK